MRRTAALIVLPLLAAAVTPAVAAPAAVAAAEESYVVTTPRPDAFPLVANGRAAPIVVSAGDHPGVVRVVGDLRDDVERVTGVRPTTSLNDVPGGSEPVLVGTIGASPLIDGLVRHGKLDVTGIAGKWETSLQQVVRDPLPGIRRALVIAGSDHRGTIYGAYDVSRRIGVSPWYWWDDVPAKHTDQLYVLPGRHTQGTPAVKYRGFFINDENPALDRWAPTQFGQGLAPGFPGGLNSRFYSRVFETMLRLKANYLWPAVWGRAFAEDDPANHATAALYGVVMGTSHEAPMMRGIEEWNRHAVPAVRDGAGNVVTPGHDPYGGTGEWSFRRNADAIKAYWADGIERMKEQGFEGVVTLGMRGNGDVGLPDGDGIELMQEILDSERQILADKGMSGVPKVWTLYKEVQRYWDKGLRAPDDVTVVFTDDNWGNMRKLPDPSLPPRAGGYGMYYHFDYVGGGRNYKWADTINLDNTWEQLDAARGYGIDRLWVVNVGDMKNEELPLQFFLDYAWRPIPLRDVPRWEKRYAAENFPARHAAEIAGVLHDYGVLQARRKPELLNRRITSGPGTTVTYDDQMTPYYLENYREMDRVTADWQRLASRAERVGRALPESYQDAYFQLVGYATKATANLYSLRRAEFTNILYARQGRAATNDLAAETDARFADDQALSTYYNTELAGGKWKNFQSQPKIGYGDVARYGPNAPWQQPELNNQALPDEVFPAVRRIQVPAAADMGVAIDGSDQWWPAATTPAVLPTFSPYQSQPRQYVEVFNRGTTPFDYRISSAQPWVSVSKSRGTVDKQVRVEVTVDWRRAPRGTTRVPLTVTGAGRTVVVEAVVDSPASRPKRGYVEANGYVSIPADGASRVVGDWLRIPDIGRDGAGMRPAPVTAPRREPAGARLEYTVNVNTTGPVTVWVYLSPRNNVHPTDGLTYAVSLDGQAPQRVNVTTATGADDTAMNRQWERNTSDNVNRTATTQVIDRPGEHVLKVWAVDPTVVVQKIVVDTGGLAPSYLGPPASTQVR
ncbi:glycosyl hydrolase 115 family protein [Actinophytocola sp.]|uniref:glycosyl hydrolase 115 family protein n=1 Tax=Actinophytocola sp. TaxID=1872138 RepID=UPI002D56355A|nr:glycosyl hydrolase 115 family protein [Actinophytocola sp.]HYQ65196.1 glycosyl hydrolase 115 family protein [Actinophytocola sp.]